MTENRIERTRIGDLEQGAGAPMDSAFMAWIATELTQQGCNGAFQPGDDIAPLGAVGVLAALAGGRPAETSGIGRQVLSSGGLGVTWLALLLIPLIWLGGHFKRWLHGRASARLPVS